MIDVNIMPFAKLMGVTIIEARAESVIAELFVREDLCTTNSILHGGAVMAFADSVGAVATLLNLPARREHDDDREQDEFRRRSSCWRDRARGVLADTYRPHDDGVANTHFAAERQALRHRDADPDDPAPAILTGAV